MRCSLTYGNNNRGEIVSGETSWSRAGKLLLGTPTWGDAPCYGTVTSTFLLYNPVLQLRPGCTCCKTGYAGQHQSDERKNPLWKICMLKLTPWSLYHAQRNRNPYYSSVLVFTTEVWGGEYERSNVTPLSHHSVSGFFSPHSSVSPPHLYALLTQMVQLPKASTYTLINADALTCIVFRGCSVCTSVFHYSYTGFLMNMKLTRPSSFLLLLFFSQIWVPVCNYANIYVEIKVSIPTWQITHSQIRQTPASILSCSN